MTTLSPEQVRGLGLHARAARHPPLSPEQLRFLDLHARSVCSHRAVLGEMYLRASAGGVGTRTATLGRAELSDLVARGMLARSHGVSVVLTEAGRAVAREATKAMETVE